MSSDPRNPADRARTSPRGIHRGLKVMEAVALVPGAADIMAEYGLHCFSCSVGGVETLEEGGRLHGFSEALIDELVDDLDRQFGEMPPCEDTVTLTAEAARAIAALLKDEGASGVLAVITDASGGFTLELREEALPDDRLFSHPDVPSVSVAVSPLYLRRIGGATIDLKDGRFRLDIPGECASPRGSCADGGCGCAKASGV